MPRTSTLPVNALLQTLRDQHEIMLLSASLSTMPGDQQEAEEVTLVIGQGHIHTCTIWARDGRPLMQGGEALTRLERLGSLQWQVQTFPGNEPV